MILHVKKKAKNESVVATDIRYETSLIDFQYKHFCSQKLFSSTTENFPLLVITETSLSFKEIEIKSINNK